MKTAILVLFLVAGFVNSAIVDSSKSPISKKTEWDDDDSMTLVSTTNAPSKSSSQDSTTTIPPPSSSAEDQITEEQQRPHFLSLIPSGNHDVNARYQSDQEGGDRIKYRIYVKEATTTVSSVSDSEQDDSSSTGGSYTTPSEEETEEISQDSASSEQSTTEATTSRIKHIQLGKIPLTYEIIPLLPPREEKQQLLGREDTTPIGFFPPEEGISDRAKLLRKEKEQEQQTTTDHSNEDENETTEVITGKPVADLEELPHVPLAYMVPPRRDGGEDQELIWNRYPQPTTTNNFRYLELPQTTTMINPLLERINEFIQKAKRHSLETETTTTKNENESTTIGTTTTTTTTSEEDIDNTEKIETTTSAEQQKER